MINYIMFTNYFELHKSEFDLASFVKVQVENRLLICAIPPEVALQKVHRCMSWSPLKTCIVLFKAANATMNLFE